MKTIVIHEEYNISSDEIIDIMTNVHYYDYLVNVRDDIVSYEIKSFKKEEDKIFMELTFQLLIKLPFFLTKLLSKLSKFEFTESIVYNLKDKTVDINVNSKSLKLTKCNYSYTYKLTDIGDNKTSKKCVFSYKCRLPIIGKRVEKVMSNNTKKQKKKDYDQLSAYIKVKHLNNIQSINTTKEFPPPKKDNSFIVNSS